jgi:IgGFc binding protein
MKCGSRQPTGEPCKRWLGPLSAIVLACPLAIAACSSSEPPGEISDPNAANAGNGGASGSGSGAGGSAIDGFFAACEIGESTCNGNEAVPCSGGSAGRDCAAEGLRCVERLGCVACLSGEGSCDDGHARICKRDGSGFEEFECDALQGLTCEPDGCKGVCSPAALGTSYIGCEYYPTVTPNPVFSGFEFAVAVANNGTDSANVYVTRGAQTITSTVVPGGELGFIELPWVSELKGGDQNACQIPPALGGSQLLEHGAYRLRTDRPVSVYQFNPLRYELTPTPEGCPLRNDCPGAPPRPDEGCLSFSNDATLLLPSNVLTGSYRALAWPSSGAGQAFISVVGTRPNTRVHIEGRGDFVAGGGLDASGTGDIVLGAGDVLQLISAPIQGRVFGADPSGSVIEADAPVQVISGSSCGFVPAATTNACDHLEQAMLPVETLGKDYLVTFPAAPGSRSPHVVRILPVLPDTEIQFEPPLPGQGASVVRSPEQGPLQIDALLQDVRVRSSAPVLIAHYMQGQESVDSGAGDPSMAIAVPQAQYRSDYIFAVSRTYDYNFVNVVAPLDATVLLDGEALPSSEFVAIGSTPYAVARHLLPDDREVFRIESSVPFGIDVYGYGQFTSYMYPGGLDLKRINPPVIR